MRLELPWVGLFLIGHGRLGFVVRETIHLRRDHTWPFERPLPDARRSMLLLGDSTAVGTGASHPRESLAGLFAAAEPQTAVRVVAKNGLFIDQLPPLIRTVRGQHFDTVVVIIGGNDVLQFTALDRMAAGLEHIITAARPLAGRLVLVHQGNLGAMPLFPRWFAPRLTNRSRAWRDIMRRAANQHQLTFVDLFHETADHPWAQDPRRFYGGDWFHPNSAGYRTWFERISRALDET